MKISNKFVSVLLCFSLLLSAAFLPMSFSASAETITAQTGETLKFSWNSQPDTVSSVYGSGEYFRPTLLKNGDIAAVYYRAGAGIRFVRSTDGGVTFSDPVVVANNVYDTADGSEPTDMAAHLSNNTDYRGRLEVQNPNIVELDNGNLMAVYRKNTYTSDKTNKPWNKYYSSISYKISEDGGETWLDEQKVREITVPEITYQTERESYPAFWEPEPIYIGDKLFVYYASTYDAYTENTNYNYQHIMYTVYDGTGFTENKIAQNGDEHNDSRDGMPVVTRLNDGNYAMVYESRDIQNVTGNTYDDTTFVVRMSFSKDGKNWTNPVAVAAPDNVGVKAQNNHKAVCCAPYVATLPDGRVAVAYRTSDTYVAAKDDSATNHSISYVVTSQVAISNDPISYFDTANETDWTDKFTKITGGPDSLGAGQFSTGIALISDYDKLISFYSTGLTSEKKNNTLERNCIELPQYSSDDDSLASYQFNSTGDKTVSDITTTNGFTLPDYNSSLLKSGYYGQLPMQKSDVKKFVVNTTTEGETETVSSREWATVDLYSADNYTLFQQNKGTELPLTFDSSNKTIKNASQTQSRSWIEGTDYMQGFYAQTTLVSASNGQLKGGFAFHLQREGFTNENFDFNDFSGYMVYLDRATSDINPTLSVRYNKSGSTTPITDTVNLSGFYTTSGSEQEAILTVWADTKNFYIEVKNGDATKSSGVLTYPLDARGTKYDFAGNTEYYSQGGFGLVAYGTVTFKDFALSNATYLEKTQDLSAKADFKMSEAYSGNLPEIGFVFGVENPVSGAELTGKTVDGAFENAGTYSYCGTAVVLSRQSTGVRLVIRKVGIGADGTLKNISSKALASSTVLKNSGLFSAANDVAGMNINMEVTVRGTLLTVKLTSTAGSYTGITDYDISDYYDGNYGGYGIYQNVGTAPTTYKRNNPVSNITFTKLSAGDIATLDSSKYDIYQSSTENGSFVGNSFVSTSGAKQKLIYKEDGTTPKIVNDFNASAIFKINENGALNSGILFRADNIANAENAMTGYAALVNKTAGTTGDESRILIQIFKYAYNDAGGINLLGEVGRSVDVTALASVVVGADKDKAVSAGTAVRLNLKVENNNATVSFDVYNSYNAVAASSEETEIDLDRIINKEGFTNSANTLYNAGKIGIITASDCEVMAFNLNNAPQTVTSTDVSQYEFYSSSKVNHSDALIADDKTKAISVNGTPNAARHYQALLNAQTSTFDVSASFVTGGAQSTYELGFDFLVTDHSGQIVTAQTGNKNGFAGYRIVLDHNSTISGTNPQRALVRLYKYSYDETNTEKPYSRAEVKVDGSRVDADVKEFFELNNYAGVEIDFTASLDAQGNLTATFQRADDTEGANKAVLTYTGTEFVGVKGKYGYFFEGDVSVKDPTVTYGIKDSLVAADTCENGMVYAAVNAGAANIGQQVKVVGVPNGTNKIDTVCYKINGVSTPVPYTRNGYIFNKPLGETSIYATFGQFDLGDINKDGAIDAKDIACMREDLLDVKPYDPEFTNVNSVDEVDICDLVKLKEIVG